MIAILRCIAWKSEARMYKQSTESVMTMSSAGRRRADPGRVVDNSSLSRFLAPVQTGWTGLGKSKAVTHPELRIARLKAQ